MGESGFDPIEGVTNAAAKGKGKASYNVDYTALSREDLGKEMQKEIDHVAGALSLKASVMLGRVLPACTM